MESELFKAIFKLEGDNTSLLKSLDEVNSKYKEQNFQFERQKTNLKTLQEREAELMRGRAAANNPTAIAKYNKLLEENKVKIDNCKKAIENLTVTEQKSAKTSEDLGKKIHVAFETTQINAAKTSVEKFNKTVTDGEKPVTSLRAQLKALKAQLAATDDDKEFLRLSVEAGKLEDKINDANQAARIFATDSPFQAVGNGIRGVAADLLAMDFDGAAQKSKLLSKAASQITFKETLKGVKDIGTSLFNLGKSLLLNPLFLIGAAVVAIIANFDKLKDSGGIVGQVFKTIGNTIDFVIQGFVKLSDWIGLTSIEANKALENSVKTLAKLQEQAITAVNNRYNLEIALARAAGKEVYNLEVEKRKAQIKTYEDAIKAQFDLVDGSEKSIQRAIKFEKQARAEINTIQHELDILRVEQAKKAADEAEKRRKEQAARDAEEAKNHADRINKQIKDIEAAELEAAEKREKSREDEQNSIIVGLEKMDEAAKKRKESLKELENEERRHEDKLDSIQGTSDSKRLQKQIAFEQSKLQALIDSGTATEVELTKQNNVIIELQAEFEKKIRDERKKRIEEEKAAIINLVQTSINAASQIVGAEITKVDQLRSLQQKKVDDVKKIADKGNAELLELEQKRLDDLNAQREKFVQRQQALATLELIANTAIAVSKAAAQGGAAAAITIAAALIALGAGLAQARSISTTAAFYDGGYTGDGDPKQESRAIGRKPYTYHKGEFVFNHEKTGKYKDIFQDIHKGNIDLNEWRGKVLAFETMKMLPFGGSNVDFTNVEKKLDAVIAVIQGQSTSVNFDENGLSMRFNKIKTRQDFIKNLARA